MKFSDMTHDEMLSRLRIVTKERDGLREQLEGWKKVAQEAEKVRDLALANQETAILGRVRAERALDSMRSEAIMRQREHAALLADANEAQERAEQERDGLHLCGESVARMAAELKVERDQANERAANMAVELAAMTLSRDLERREAKDWKTKLAVERFRVQALVDKNFVLATRSTDCETALRLERQEDATLRRQVDVMSKRLALLDDCPHCGPCEHDCKCAPCWSAWASKQAKEGGK
jgi:hypothetical protein